MTNKAYIIGIDYVTKTKNFSILGMIDIYKKTKEDDFTLWYIARDPSINIDLVDIVENVIKSSDNDLEKTAFIKKVNSELDRKGLMFYKEKGSIESLFNSDNVFASRELRPFVAMMNGELRTITYSDIEIVDHNFKYVKHEQK